MADPDTIRLVCGNCPNLQTLGRIPVEGKLWPEASAAGHRGIRLVCKRGHAHSFRFRTMYEAREVLAKRCEEYPHTARRIIVDEKLRERIARGRVN